jgi:hypothetical protein
MEYRIEANQNLNELINAVNEALQAGWVPAGGLAIYPGHIVSVGAAPPAVSAPRYYQALTRG